MNPEGQPQFETGPETMKLPEIIIKEEKGATLLSMLLKGYNPDWGGGESELSDEAEQFFEQNPLNKKSVDYLKNIKALEDDGVDGEILFNIAFTLEKPERIEELFEFIKNHKADIKNPQELRENILKILVDLEQSLPDSLKREFQKAIQEDIEKRKQNIGDTENRIKDLIDFFRPKSGTTQVKKINILPTDFLASEKSGVCFELGKELFIISNINNPDNINHEFLHSVINPIVDKLSEKLKEEQKQKISRLGSHRLRVEEKYGEDFYSLLCEEFIRTYNDVVQKGEKPMTHEDFVQKISQISEEQFSELLQKNKTLRSRCDQLGIKNLQDLRGNSQEYFDRFERNELRETIFVFYQKYIQEKNKDNKITFEDFVLREFDKEV